MKRSGFKPKRYLTPAQLQIKMELAQWKQQQRANSTFRQAPRQKYGNIKCYHDGLRFDSLLEREHYIEFQLMAKGNMIAEYEFKRRFPLHVLGVEIGEIEPDHFYYDLKEGVHVVSDTKSPKSMTPLFKWKWAHMQVEYPQYCYEIRMQFKDSRTYPKKDLTIEDYQRTA
jgi:hypothetical protein